MKDQGHASGPLGLWGGIECTLNRVGDIYLDQLERNGHAWRVSDLNQIAELGISAIRYPVLWERHASGGDGEIDWSWADQRLGRLRELGMQPIVGLVHHGSGPRHTNLTDPSFATGLASFARAVAERYPWIRHYTPVNEPLTTARFSGLYGIWYPHGLDEQTFAQAYLNQLRAIVLAMQEIRQVNPDAELVQTEDLGKTHSTALLGYQADHENERRWLSYDLLTGNLGPDKPMWGFLQSIGASEDDLFWFQENACPPGILGINHYLTSERYLDERLHLFPEHSHGGNGLHQYADVEAVRVAAVELAGVGGLLREAWERYRRPLAITELHLGCTREEQLRWFMDGWEAARSLRAEGIDVRAVTAWSMLGAFDWNCLVARVNGYYEPGVFDVRGSELRPTALAGLLKALASGDNPTHPAIEGPGWWRREDRWFYPFGHPLAGAVDAPDASERGSRPSIVVIGGGDTGTTPICRHCQVRGLEHHLLSASGIDLEHPELTLDQLQPWAVIVEMPEPAGVLLDRTRTLGRYCAERGISLLVLTVARDAGDDRVDRVLSSSFEPVRPEAVGKQLLEAAPEGLIVLSDVGVHDNGWSTCVAPDDVLTISLDLLIDGEQGVWAVRSTGEQGKP